jgi:hypothetical protein
MKTISIGEFESLVSRNDWKRIQSFSIEERIDDRDEKGEMSLPEDRISITRGRATLTSTLGTLSIIYTEGYEYSDNAPCEIVRHEGREDSCWRIGGDIQVVDEDGSILSVEDFSDYLNDSFSSIRYSDLEF